MKKFSLTAALVVLLLPLVGAVLLPAKPVKAASAFTVTWIDYAHIQFSQSQYGDSGTFNKVQYTGLDAQNTIYTLAEMEGVNHDLVYTINGVHSGSCIPEIRVNTDYTDAVDPWYFLPHSIREVNLRPADARSNGLCTTIHIDGKDVDSLQFDNSKVLFSWADESTLQPVGTLLPYPYNTDKDQLQKYELFIYKDSLQYFQESSSRNCPSYIDKISSDNTSATFNIGDFGATGTCNDDFDYHVPVRLGSVENASKKAGSGSVSNVFSGGASNPKIGCEASVNPLTWLACPIIAAANTAINQLDTAINHELLINTKQYLDETATSSTSAGSSFFKAWSIVRYLSMSLLVIIILIMVISQALSIGIFDAYSVRKILPRIVLAVIFISVSWSLLKVAVDLSNDLGVGVRQLIYAPFAGKLTDTFNISGGSEAVVTFGAVGLGLGLGLIGLLSFGVTALLAVFTAFIVLVFRKMGVLLLIIFSPLAIVASILPNTSRLWKFWHENFTRLLVVYPIITGFIAFGRVFASITSNDPGGAGLLNQIIVFIAYFGPYFALPFAIRLAGGLVGTVASIANDRSRGAFDRLKKFRRGQYKKNWTATKAGNRFRGQNIISRRASRALQTGTLIPAGGFTTSVAKRRSRMQTARGARTFDDAAQFLENNSAAHAIKGDDDKLWAVMEGNNEEQVRSILQQRAPGRFADANVLNNAVADVMRFKREAGEQVGRVAATIAQAGTGTGYNYSFNDERDDMLTSIIKASGDDRGLSGRMLATMRPMAAQSGRVDLAGGGFAKQAIAMDNLRVAKANGGMINIAKPSEPEKWVRYDQAQARIDILQDVLNSNAGAAVAGKVEAVKHLAPVMKANVDDAFASGDMVKAARELAKIAGKYDAAGQVAPQNAEALADGILSQGIVVDSYPPQVAAQLRQIFQVPAGQSGVTYQQAIEALRNNPDFQTMRREYGMAGLAAARASASLNNPPGTIPGQGPVVPGAPI